MKKSIILICLFFASFVYADDIKLNASKKYCSNNTSTDPLIVEFCEPIIIIANRYEVCNNTKIESLKITDDYAKLKTKLLKSVNIDKIELEKACGSEYNVNFYICETGFYLNNQHKLCKQQESTNDTKCDRDKLDSLNILTEYLQLRIQWSAENIN